MSEEANRAAETRTCMAEVLQGALETVLPGAVFPIVYTGGLTEYIVWNYNVLPAVWAEHAPQAARYLVQVHYYLPHKQEPREKLLSLQSALFNADFTWPNLTDAADAEGQHWVLECEYADGGGYYGFT